MKNEIILLQEELNNVDSKINMVQKELRELNSIILILKQGVNKDSVEAMHSICDLCLEKIKNIGDININLVLYKYKGLYEEILMLQENAVTEPKKRRTYKKNTDKKVEAGVNNKRGRKNKEENINKEIETVEETVVEE